MPLKGFQADISDGRGFFTGTVHDISRFGVALDDIPEKMNSHATQFTIIVDGQGKRFRLKIVPKWETAAGHQKSIGCQIEQSPYTWAEFVMGFEPDDNEILGSS